LVYRRGSNQKVRGQERGLNDTASRTTNPIGRQRVPNLTHASTAERGNPVHLSPTPHPCRRCLGRQVSRRRVDRPRGCAERCAGLRCRKKRTPRCNGADTGCNITGRKSEPTSDGSFVAREFDEPPERENADDGSRKAPGALSASGRGHGGCKRVSRRSRRSIAPAGSCESGLPKGLSRMRGNSHVRF